MRDLNLLAGIASIIAFLAFLSFLLSFPTYFLWNNCLIGAVDGVNEVTWLQAWGINLLVGAMFRSGTTFGKGEKS